MSTYVFARNGMGNYLTGTGMREDMLMQPFNILNYQAGIVISTDLAVTQRAAGANMSVDVAPGRCFVANTSYVVNTANSTKFWGVLSDAITNLPISTNTSGSTRYDLIIVKVNTGASANDYATNVATVEVVEGTPGAGVPATPSNSLKLAEIEVADGTTTQIVTADITDSRVRSLVDAGNVIVQNNTDGLKGEKADGSIVDIMQINTDDEVVLDQDTYVNHLKKLGVFDSGGNPESYMYVDSNGLTLEYRSGLLYAVYVPSGSTDVELQAALDLFTGVYGGIVYMMGTVTITSTIVIDWGQRLVGKGIGYHGGGGSQIIIGATLTSAINITGAWGRLENFGIRRSSSSFTCSRYIDIDAGGYYHIDNVHIWDLGNNNKDEIGLFIDSGNSNPKNSAYINIGVNADAAANANCAYFDIDDMTGSVLICRGSQDTGSLGSGSNVDWILRSNASYNFVDVITELAGTNSGTGNVVREIVF